MIRHVSLLTFTPGTEDTQVRAIIDALDTLRGRLPMRRYDIGRDLALNEGNASFGVVADFASVSDYRAYRDDPEHNRIIAELIRPILADRTAVQYEIPE